jgi:cobalt-zinc-cadmium efflux system membrane fusion protein
MIRTRTFVFGAIGAGVVAVVVGLTLLIDHTFHSHDQAGDHEEHGEGREHSESEAHDDGRIKLSPEQVKNAGIEVKPAGPARVSVTLALPGEVSLNADKVAHVTPRVGGNVREVRKQLGDTVKKGEVLAILDSRDLADIQREFLATKERLGLAEANFKRQEQLWIEKVSAEKDYLAAKQALAEAKIEHRTAAQKLSAAGGNSAGGGGYALVAPLDGTIIEKHITLGEVLKDDSQAFIIADLSTIWVTVTIYAKDLERVRVGQAVEVRAEGIEKSAKGSLTYVGPVVGEQTRSATGRVVLQDPGSAWRPGLFVTAEVVIDEAPALVTIDSDAIQTIDGKQVVFVEEGGGFKAHTIELGRGATVGHGAVEILGGLKAGERYVVKNSFVLKAELGKGEAGHEH